MNPNLIDDMVSSYLYEEISKHPGHDDQQVHAGQAAGVAGLGLAGEAGRRQIKRRGNARDAARTNLSMATRTTLPDEGTAAQRARTSAGDLAGRGRAKGTQAGMKARDAASRLGESARSTGVNARINAALLGEKGRSAGRFARDEAKGAAGSARSAGRSAGEGARSAGRAAGETASRLGRSGKKRAWQGAGAALTHPKTTGGALAGAAALGGGYAYSRRKKKDVAKAYDLYDEVEKIRFPKPKKPSATQMPIPGMAKPTMGSRAAGAGRSAGQKVRTAGATARDAGRAGAAQAAFRTRGAQSPMGNRMASRASSGAPLSRGAKAGIGAGAGAGVGGAAYASGRRKREDQFGKADHVYEIAKAFREDRLAGYIGHEYDLTTDPDLYSDIADRFVSKIGGSNFDTPDVDAVYAEMGGDWVPVEDVLVEMAKALYLGDDETAELIAYAIS